MRSRVVLLTVIATSVAVIPMLAYAQGIPFWGPIIPAPHDSGVLNSDVCPLGWAGLITVMNNIILFALTLAIFFVAPLTIGYAGFLLVVNPVNASAKSKAKSILLNTVIGIVVALAGWLIVDALMAALYNPGKEAFGTQWYNIITTGGQKLCLEVKGSLAQAPLGSTVPSGGGLLPNAPALGTGPIQNPNTNCTADSLRNVFGAKAEAMSCVTHYEDSTCNPLQASGIDKGSDGKPVSIGIFQINLSAPLGNLADYPACTAANGGVPLNCNQAFAGGTYTAQNHNTHVVDQVRYLKCVKAVSVLECNEQVALTILNKQGLGGWGERARANCSSLAASPLQSLLSSVMVSFEQLFSYEQ